MEHPRPSRSHAREALQLLGLDARLSSSSSTSTSTKQQHQKQQQQQHQQQMTTPRPPRPAIRAGPKKDGPSKAARVRKMEADLARIQEYQRYETQFFLSLAPDMLEAVLQLPQADVPLWRALALRVLTYPGVDMAEWSKRASVIIHQACLSL